MTAPKTAPRPSTAKKPQDRKPKAAPAAKKSEAPKPMPKKITIEAAPREAIELSLAGETYYIYPMKTSAMMNMVTEMSNLGGGVDDDGNSDIAIGEMTEITALLLTMFQEEDRDEIFNRMNDNVDPLELDHITQLFSQLTELAGVELPPT